MFKNVVTPSFCPFASLSSIMPLGSKRTTFKTKDMMKYTYLLLLAVAWLTSCKTPQDITYLQDVNVNVPIKSQTDGSIRFQPGDKLSIYVHSRDEKLISLFNLSRNASTGGASSQLAYTVDERGEINFPVLGMVKVQGFTRNEVARTIERMLISEDYCKDPVVTVAFYDMSFSVLGSTGAGVKQITKDKITILEAVAMAGDLNIDGLRKNVLVMRQEGGQQVPYRVDLTRAESIYNSPVYYIRQNDVLYVEPNDKSKRNSTVMASSAYQPGFWFGMFGSVVSVGTLIWAILK